MKCFDQFKFAQKLENTILEKGYSVKDVADYLDVSTQAVYGWIDGRKMAKIDNLIPLADLIDVKLDDLIPSYETEWKGTSLNGRNIAEKHIQNRKKDCNKEKLL